MISAHPRTPSDVSPPPPGARLDYLDATRAFALVLGVVFHASLSFMPVFMGWAVQDISTSPVVGIFVMVSHSFRMEAFFLMAGFFSRLTYHRKGERDFILTRALRIVVPLVAGWFILRPLVVSGWIMGSASLRGDYYFGTGIANGFRTLATLPMGIFAGTHLWFLYYLAMVTALTLAVRKLINLNDSLRQALVRRADAVLAWLAVSNGGFPMLVIPVAIAVWFMRFWGMDTPDQTLRPHLPVLFVYGSFFVFGWLLSRQRELIPSFTQLSPQRWILAGISAAITLTLSEIQLDPGHPYHTAAHVGFVVSYSVMMWSFVFLMIGVFRKLCQQSRPWIRYVADSSYWMYLIHLPIVVWLQVAVAEVPLHWSVKLAFVAITTVVISLLSYDLFVRSTWLGQLLHGRRRNRITPNLLFNSPTIPRTTNP